MRYLDSNVFLYAILYTGRKASAARAVLEETVGGAVDTVTASLTIDEVIWILMNQLSRKKALEAGKYILSMPNLKVLDVKARDIALAVHLMEAHDHLSPRDAIHGAVCLHAGADAIVTDDADFDGVDGLERVPLG